MKRRRIISCLVSAIALSLGFAGVLRSEDKDEKGDDAAVEGQLDKLVQLGPGVHKIKTNKRGEVVSCVVVGQSRISAVLGAAKGKEIARKRADLNGNAEFVKWLNEEVTVRQKSKSESILLLEGAEGGDEETLTESGKAVEKDSEVIKRLATGYLRGMVVLHVNVDPEEQSYTVVKGWSREGAKAARELARGSAAGSGRRVKAKKEFKRKKVTSEDAKEFLDD